MHSIDWQLPNTVQRQNLSVPDLHKALLSAGYDISRSQLYRLVQEPPATIKLDLLYALTRVLRCELQDIIRCPAPPPDRKAGGRRQASHDRSDSIPRIPFRSFSEVLPQMRSKL